MVLVLSLVKSRYSEKDNGNILISIWGVFEKRPELETEA
jgi:hypothetical protein